jgi:hypothetical protein
MPSVKMKYIADRTKTTQILIRILKALLTVIFRLPLFASSI